eukprot:2079233-Pyramimonas_sp.AAC.1
MNAAVWQKSPVATGARTWRQPRPAPVAARGKQGPGPEPLSRTGGRCSAALSFCLTEGALELRARIDSDTLERIRGPTSSEL